MQRCTWSLALAGLLLLGTLSACSNDNNESASGQKDSSSSSSGELPSAKSTPNPDRESSGGEPSDGDSSTSDTLIPENIGACFDEAAAFATAMGLAVTDPKAADEALDKVQAKLPESLSDDLAVIQDAFRVAQDTGSEGGAQAMDTQEFVDAATAIGSYFGNECGSSGQ